MNFNDLKLLHSNNISCLRSELLKIYTDVYNMENSIYKTPHSFSSFHKVIWTSIISTFSACPIHEIAANSSNLAHLARSLEILSRNTTSMDVHSASSAIEMPSKSSIDDLGIQSSEKISLTTIVPVYPKPHVATLYSLHRDATTRISDLANKLPTLDVSPTGELVKNQLSNLLQFDVTLASSKNSFTDDLDIYLALISKALPKNTTTTCFKLDKSSLVNYKTFWQLSAVPSTLCDLVYGITHIPNIPKNSKMDLLRSKLTTVMKKRVLPIKTGLELLKTIPMPKFDDIPIPSGKLTSRKSNKGTKYKKRGFCSPLPNI
jgi:hypothetical protein